MPGCAHNKNMLGKTFSITMPTSNINTMSSQITGNTHSESIILDNNITVSGSNQSSSIDNTMP